MTITRAKKTGPISHPSCRRPMIATIEAAASSIMTSARGSGFAVPIASLMRPLSRDWLIVRDSLPTRGTTQRPACCVSPRLL
jgi:hypothetical protein